MKKIHPIILSIIFACVAIPVSASVYKGRVLTPNGEGIGYATVYPIDDPIAGTATNDNGTFHFETDLPPDSRVIISFIGYEKQELPLIALSDSAVVVLREQPVALEETVVAAKASKQRNKRKQLAALLHAVYIQMDKDFSDTPTAYRIVSDVRMDSEGEAWGMEQMIARVVALPGIGHDGRDSIQFEGEYCKRYFKQAIRQRADTIYVGGSLERMDKNMRRMATDIDSGVVVHQALFSLGNIRRDFENSVNDLKHWVVSNESEGETVFTHTEKRNYFGIVKYSIIRHYIVDSETFSVRRFTEHGKLYVNIPFGYKLNDDQLQFLNLLNMSEHQIEKFRLRKANADVTLNTIYQRYGGHLYILEKNLHTDANIIGTKKVEIPVKVNATQRVTSLNSDNVQPMKKNQMIQRVKRQIVEIY